MAKFEFEDEGSRLMNAFNESAGARARRARILDALDLAHGARVLDVGSGPGHQVLEIASVVGAGGRVDGIDPAETAIKIARHRCSKLGNVRFQPGRATKIPFSDSTFDAAVSSQTLEYVDDVSAALVEMFRILKPGGRVLIHDTDWGTLQWRSNDKKRMARIMKVLQGAFADPYLPHTLGERLAAVGFENIRADAIVQLGIDYDPTSVSGVLMESIAAYVTSNGVAQEDVEAWATDLRERAAQGQYFFASNEFIFTGIKPSLPS
jgi:arsenite methyltransferase